MTKEYSEIIDRKMFKLHCPEKFYILPILIVSDSLPSMSLVFASMDSTNLGSKIFRKNKIPGSSKKQNLSLLCTSNYLRNIYVVLGIISNVEMI